MRRKKKPRSKTYSTYSLLRSQARRCALYRWISEDVPADTFHAVGPFPDAQNESLCDWATRQSDNWHCQVISYFLDDQGNYYDEIAVIPSFGPVKLAGGAESLTGALDELVSQTKQAGNPNHYQNTILILRLHTPGLEAKHESDEWLLDQARKRAELVFTHTGT